jgi:hypothetical protein
MTGPVPPAGGAGADASPGSAGDASRSAAAPVWTMGDWSDPGTGLYTGVDAGACYLGGATPHVWTLAQVRAQTCRWLLPVWVYFPGRPGPEAGTADGQAALAAARSWGMPAGRLAIDMETWADYAYTRAFRDVIAHAGWTTVVYGSASSLFGNYCPGGGWWVADWVGHPYQYPGDHVWATQAENAAQAGRPWDMSWFSDSAGLWEANPPARKPPPVTQHALLLPGIGLGSTIKAAAAAGLRPVTSADGGKTWR